jgi:hypothetical protein
MSVGRYTNEERQQMEVGEGALGRMAQALLTLELVHVRVSMAKCYDPALLVPAMEDISAIRKLIRESQEDVVGLLPSSARASEV